MKQSFYKKSYWAKVCETLVCNEDVVWCHRGWKCTAGEH